MLRDEVLEEVGHSQWVFVMPKMLRLYFLHHRDLLGKLARAAWETVLDLMIEASGLGNWTSTDGVTLQPGSGWQTAVFGLTEEAMTRVKGLAPLDSLLADITTVAPDTGFPKSSRTVTVTWL